MDTDTTGPDASLASIACLSCKSRKQKCDKSRPTCSRCKRLLLKCHYSKEILSPPASDDLERSSLGHSDQVLVQDFYVLQNEKSHYTDNLTLLIEAHKQQLVQMAEIFLSSCQKWVSIVHKDTFRDRCNDSRLNDSRDFVILLLVMGMITRPRMSGNQPDSLRELMYEVVKRLFWDKESVARPSLALVQAGLLLSVYEYGHGLLDASYLTISICSSMAHVSGVCGRYKSPPLPSPGGLAAQDEMLHTWWGIIIHERMISLKSNRPISQLSMQDTDAMENALLEEELQSIMPKLVSDQHYAAFCLQARAAIWLDRVLGVVQSSTVGSTEDRIRFEAVDRGLLHFLRILVQLGMGSCCESISIGLNAFFCLHHWRLENEGSIFTEQERHESSQAITTVLTVLSDIAFDEVHARAAAGESDDEVVELFPYTITMLYQLCLEIQGHRLRYQQAPYAYEQQMTLLVYILDKQSERWKISDHYLGDLHGQNIGV